MVDESGFDDRINGACLDLEFDNHVDVWKVVK